jgi:signal transduction histidine kinase
LNALAREAVQLAKPGMASTDSRLSRVHENFGNPPTVLGQPSEIVSALLNLLVNAAHAAPDGANITVRTGEKRSGGWVAVADDGPGMSPEVQARVFEPFFTTKGAKGTGLGLAMVYATMNRHQGTVHLETEPGKGATFTLWFPPPAA